MKNVIVIADLDLVESLRNLITTSMADKDIASGISKISEGSWLVDVHKSFSFVSALVHGAALEGRNVFVFSVDDIIHVPKGWKIPDQALK